MTSFVSETSGAQTLTDSHYKYPLYFGNFYWTNNATDYNVNDENGFIKKPQKGKVNKYNNFYWQANMGLKNVGSAVSTGNEETDKTQNKGDYVTETDGNGFRVRGTASVQGLVDNQLYNSTDSDPDKRYLGKLTQNGNELPYFNSGWNDTYITSYENNGNGYEFPFYEVLTPANTVKGTGADDEKARFYQFNSSDANLYFNSSTGFEERTAKIASSMGKVVFFPFNDSNSDGGKLNNLGFGSKFEMTFKLNADGKVSALDSNGKSKDGAGKINTMFEFTGDDDLWVFIDGNLVLDLGGDHSQTSGFIDFAERKAVANKAFVIDPTGDMDDLGVTSGLGSQTVMDTFSSPGVWAQDGGGNNQNDFTSLLGGNNTASAYDTGYTHHMTIFYMERGMLDSNLLIRFNYAIEANFTKMKVQQVTNFTGVNPGLLNATKKAADNDVFKYTILNKGTQASQVEDSGALYPTYDTYTRNVLANNGTTSLQSTTLTHTELDYRKVTDADAIFLQVTGNWSNDSAKFGAWIGKNGSDYKGALYIGELVPNTTDVYKFTGLPNSADKVKFYRFNPSEVPTNGRCTELKTSPKEYWNVSAEVSLNKGKLYAMPTNAWDNVQPTYGASTNYEADTLYFQSNTKFIPGSNYNTEYQSVSGTSYLWVDDFASLSGNNDDGFDGMTGKTTNTGDFYLMYGTTKNDTVHTSSKESSAEFEHQFVKDSHMKVIQNNTLEERTVITTSTGASTRTVSDYYHTNVTLRDRVGNTRTLSNDLYNNNDGTTAFDFEHQTNNVENGKAVDASLPVYLTETFTSTPIVGAITIKKSTVKTSEEGAVDDDFTFMLQLKNIFGTNVTLDDYSDIEIKKYDAHGNDVTGSDGVTNVANGGNPYGTFTLKAGQTLTISGIPKDTQYYITEIDNGDNYQQSSTTMSGYETVYEGSIDGNHQSTGSGNNETIVNVRLTGTLELKKKLGANADDNGKTASDTFTYQVKLKGAAGVTLSDYASGITRSDSTALNLGSYDSSDNSYTFTVSDVSENIPVTITSIPYGTQYTVTEVEASRPTGTGASVEGEVTNVTLDKDNASAEVEITNNFPIINSVLKIKEETDFSDVNGGLQNITKKAADDDVFKYTVSNTGTAAENVHDSGIKYPTLDQYDRNVQSQTTTLTYNNTDTPSVHIYKPTVDGSSVKNTNYIWTDAAAALNATHQNIDDFDVMTGQTDNTGSFYLMYGTSSSESSAEFRKQFKRDSTMTVVQGDTLYSPNNRTDKPSTLSSNNVRGASKPVNEYYNGSISLTGSSSTSPNGSGEFTFGDGNSSGDFTITETFTNKVRVGAITVTKQMSTNDDVEFNFNLRLTSVFGNSNVDVDSYDTITINRISSDNTRNGSMYLGSGTMTVSSETKNCGTFSLKPGETVTITGIPYDTDYVIEEVANSNYDTPSYTNANGSIVEGTLNASNKSVTLGDSPTETNNNATVVNTHLLGNLTLEKITAGTVPSGVTSYEYTVNLTAPDGVTLGSYTIKDGSNNTYTGNSFTVNVPKDGTIELSGIPYGTQYSVSETATLPAGVWHSDTVYTAGTQSIDSNTHKATVTNYYPNSLTLQKTTSDGAPNISFSFTVTLTNSHIDLTNSSNYNISDGTTSITLTNGSFPVSITGAGSVTITGIPYDTNYTVVENTSSLPPNWTQGTTNNTDNTITTSSQTATINNVYTPPVVVKKTLTLQKVDRSKNNDLITSGSATFKLLKLPAGFNPESSTDIAALQNAINNSTYATYANVVGTYTTSNGRFIISEDTGTNSSLNYYGVTFDENRYYFFYEESQPSGFQIDNTVTANKIFKMDADEVTVSYPNMPDSTGVTVEKVDSADTSKKLSGAEFDLYYKANRTTPTKSINEPVIEPDPIPSVQLTARSLSIPDAATGEVTTSYTYTYTHSYSDETPPSSTETSWILPRTDNDYIYFRDYNTGTTGEHDMGLSNHAWLNTDFEINKYGQSQEIKYTHNYWFAAQFRKSGSSKTDQYAVWERFVDTYDGKNTIVWKIQPPDGYTYVRFMMFDGDNCIRTTKEFKYVLGNIYTKTSWGGMYKYENGQHCYFDVPVTGQHWSSYWNKDGTSDRRMDYSSGSNPLYTTSPNTKKYVYSQTTKDGGTNANQVAPVQADRYTATPQKVVFHCNSSVVWHNIHIEFFSDEEGTTPIGQSYPGYMMEPYAYANEEYRVNGYLTYELTIPKGAKSFRVNNGIDLSGGSSYRYSTAVTKIYCSTYNPTIEGKRAMEYKNYHNYFKLNGSVSNGSPVPLKTWSNSFIRSVGDDPDKQYSNNFEVESDCDYIYFAKPTSSASWGNQVYAYFYGGGDLRKDNWQRACYSIWPGVAPAATEYHDTSDKHSDIYTYSYNNTLYGDTNGTYNLNPDATFVNGDYTIYKFRIPLGDRTNYSKVIFNNGLSITNSASKETSVISYKAGYLYYPNGTSEKHYENKPTYTYSDRGDDLYVKVKTNQMTNWDDIHVTFYNSSDTQILQGGSGYVMKYSGTNGDYTYFSVPIPTNAKKFSINNGYKKSGSHNISTSDNNKPIKYDIYEKVTTATETGQTQGNMVYTLDTSANKLSIASPTFTTTKTGTPVTVGSGVQIDDVDYVPRGDKLYIRNTANWTIGQGSTSNTNAGGRIQFFDANGAVIKNSDGIAANGNGTYTMVQTVNETDNAAAQANTGRADATPAQWYEIDIPKDAVSFTLKYNNGAKSVSGSIYPLVSGSTGTDGNFTTGGMYYETNTAGSTDSLSLLWPKFTNTADATDYHDDNWTNARHDALYLVCSDKSAWNGMKVTFYNANGTAIKNSSDSSEIRANYIGQLTSATPAVNGTSTSVSEAVGYWFKVNIPDDAATFVASNESRTTVTGDIYEFRTKVARYRTDYTLGDMQYRILDTQTGADYNLKRFYPQFTEDENYTLTVSDGQTITSDAGITLVDETEVSNYFDTSVAAPSATTPAVDNTNVLHQTANSSTNTITYTWQEGGNDELLRFDNGSVGWTISGNLVAIFKSDNNIVQTGNMSGPSSNIYSVSCPTNFYDKVIFRNGSNSITVSTSDARNKKLVKNVTNGVYNDSIVRFDNSTTNWTKVYVNFWSGDTESGNWYEMQDPDGDKIFEYTVSGSPDHVRFSSDMSATSNNPKTIAMSKTNGGKGALFTPSYTDYKMTVIIDDDIAESGQLKGFFDDSEYKNWGGDCYNSSGTNYLVTFDLKNLNDWGTSNKVTFFLWGSDTIWQSTVQDISGTPKNGGGRVYKITSTQDGTSYGHPIYKAEFLGMGTSSTNSGSWSDSGPKTTYELENYSAQVVYSTKFQPEDRYGYISTHANMSDDTGTTNNFVKVVNNASGLNDLHIAFYASNETDRVDVATGVSGQSYNSYGIKLKPDTVDTSYPKIDNTQYTAVGNGTAASPYLVRLPKNAKYAQFYNGNTAVGSKVSLTDSHGLTGGVTLTIASDSSVSASHPERNETAVQANQKKTDIDYIYFTDVGGTMGSNIKAHYFGDVDGEYAQWPGVAPSYSYTDNNGNTVYAFQPPNIANSTGKAYPCVIFNNGGNYGAGGTVMTEAVAYTSSGNYKLDSTTTVPYYSVAARKLTTVNSPKTSNSTVDFSTTSTNGKYIFFVNNGTADILSSGSRYTLDDVHITFYGADGSTVVGTAAPSYVMDKVAPSFTKGSVTGALYRMAIPNDAKYFQINNGQAKGTASTAAGERRRMSEIKKISPNGLYSFVQSADNAADYIEETEVSGTPSNDYLSTVHFLLDILNPRAKDDEEDIPKTDIAEIKLATVVTGSDGKPEYIKWLKLNDDESQVDWTYLDHTLEDIYDPVHNTGRKVTAVKVIQKGDYYWKETVAPSGYKIMTEITEFTVGSTAVNTQVENEAVTGEVILTKTVKEKVGSKDVGTALEGAKFQLIKIKSDGTDDTSLRFTKGSATDIIEYTSGSGEYNDTNKWLETGTAGKLKITGLQPGDYYLKEIEAPDGYTNLDSNDVNASGVAQPKKVYFSVGSNTVTKNITMSDEMDPAYIRLFEHINEKKEAWGNPTFIFKITRTKDANGTDIAAVNQRTQIVSLTVDDDYTITDTIKWYNNGSSENFSSDPISDDPYNTDPKWLVEGTTESQYKGMYHIDSKGRIKVEPGTYSITRIPVSRYEFVTSGHVVYNTDTEPGVINNNDITTGTETAETVTLTAGQTGDIHYYDKVGYYDKFSQVDEEINKFYTLDSTTKANKTIKGIRIADYHSTLTSGALNLNGSNLTVYAIYADGSEGELNSTEKAKITFNYTDVTGEPAPFTPTLSGDSKTLTVSDVTAYTGNVYTITATYPYDSDTDFTATFDLVFSRT